MSEVFISYARGSQGQAHGIAEILRGDGYAVWRDDELPAHRDYSEVIEERLREAKAVVVVWSAEAVKSQWVRAEADVAREAGTLVQLTLDGAPLPMPFGRIQCADLTGWAGDPSATGWKKVAASVAELVGGRGPILSAPPAAASAAPLLPDKPSIAVLPFADPSGAVEGDYFADGMVDEIVAALSRFPSLFVIASGSGLSYRGRDRDFKKIGRELGVRYLLEGSVKRSGTRVRISVDLVGAEAGAQIWSERFERTLEDVFALQDEVANAVAARIEPTIQSADLRRGAARPTEDLGAYDLYLRALQQFREFNASAAKAAIALLEQAVARDPEFHVAWAELARLQVTNLGAGWTADPGASARKAQEAIRHATLADDDALALVEVAFATVVLGGDRNASLAMADRALTLNPGSFQCWNFAGWISSFCGDSNLAFERFHQALRLNPRSPERHQALAGVGTVLVHRGKLEEALPWLNESLTLRPDFPTPQFMLVVALSNLGRIEEAKVALARLEELSSVQRLLAAAEVLGAASALPAFRRLGVDV